MHTSDLVINVDVSCLKHFWNLMDLLIELHTSSAKKRECLFACGLYFTTIHYHVESTEINACELYHFKFHATCVWHVFIIFVYTLDNFKLETPLIQCTIVFKI